MTFDGETAKFLGDVLTVIQQSRMRCPEMEVLLTERISFSDADRGERDPREDSKVDIKFVICKGGVDAGGDARSGRLRGLLEEELSALLVSVQPSPVPPLAVF